MTENQDITTKITELTVSVNFWNAVIIVMMVVAAAAALGLVIVQYVAFKKAEELAINQELLNIFKDKQLEIELKDKDLRIADSNSRAEEAKSASAKANARAAEANQIAETERTERLKLELKLAPRVIEFAKSIQLSKQLLTYQGIDVDIISYEGMGSDVSTLSLQIAEMLRRARIKAKVFTPNFP